MHQTYVNEAVEAKLHKLFVSQYTTTSFFIFGLQTFISLKLTLISMGIVPPLAAGAIIYGRYLRKITKKVQDSLAESTHVS